MQASRQNMNFVYLQKTKILILHLFAINHFYLATKFRNIMNDLQTQFEHSMFNSLGTFKAWRFFKGTLETFRALICLQTFLNYFREKET